MIVASGAVHGELPLKKPVIATIEASNHEVLDLDTFDEIPVDSPDFAKSVADSIINAPARREILICGSDVCACIAANRLTGIHAGLCHDVYSAHPV